MKRQHRHAAQKFVYCATPACGRRMPPESLRAGKKLCPRCDEKSWRAEVDPADAQAPPSKRVG